MDTFKKYQFFTKWGSPRDSSTYCFVVFGIHCPLNIMPWSRWLDITGWWWVVFRYAYFRKPLIEIAMTDHPSSGVSGRSPDVDQRNALLADAPASADLAPSPNHAIALYRLLLTLGGRGNCRALALADVGKQSKGGQRPPILVIRTLTKSNIQTGGLSLLNREASWQFIRKEYCQ